MKIPEDCPRWVLRFLEDMEALVESKIEKAETADDALKASGAYGLWRRIKEEVELEADRQAEAVRSQIKAMNAR